MIIAPIVLLILPADFFDQGQSLCLSVLLLDEQCYGCGMTRGIMHLIHFDFQKAYQFNFLSFIAFPIMVYVWVDMFISDSKKLNQLKNQNLSKP